MKPINYKIALITIFTMGFGSLAYAQCDKPYKLTSSETSFLDGSGTVTRTKAEDVTVTVTSTDITIEPNDDPKMTGKILSKTCNWTVPFKEGKTVIKTIFSDQQGDKHATVTIEGKTGKVCLTFEAEEMKDKKIQIVADKFE